MRRRLAQISYLAKLVCLFGVDTLFGRLRNPDYVPDGMSVWMACSRWIGFLSALPFSRWHRFRRMLRAAGRVEFLITFYWGGGAADYLKRYIRDAEPGTTLLVVKPTLAKRIVAAEVWQSGRCRLRFWTYGLAWFNRPELRPSKIVLNELVLWNRYVGLRRMTAEGVEQVVGEILGLSAVFNTGVLYFVHDYYSICPRITLLTPAMRYCGQETDVRACQECMRNGVLSGAMVEPGCDVVRWRAAFGRLFRASAEVRTFSEDTRRRMCTVFPDIAFTCVPHAPLAAFDRKPHLDCSRMTVGIFGNISRLKGSEELLELADYVRDIGAETSFVVVGTLEVAPERIPYSVRVLGHYRRQDLPRIVEREGINVAAFLSIWPETFSYVVQEIVQLGLPVVTYPIGAPVERIVQLKIGTVASDFTSASMWTALQGQYEALCHGIKGV